MESLTDLPVEVGDANAATQVFRMDATLPSRGITCTGSLCVRDNWIYACRSALSKAVLDRADRYATSPLPVMIVGECGTGKLQLAQHLVAQERRGGGDVVHVACGTVFSCFAGRLAGSDSLTRILLQRHNQHPAATWFFESVDEVPADYQPQFLRLVDEILMRSSAGDRPVIVSTAKPGIIAATEESRYRQELFYRLNVLGLKVPALRERMDDLPYLVAHFSSHLRSRDVQPLRFTADASSLLCQHHWPGNILELRNLVSQLCVLSNESVIDSEQLLRHWHVRRPRPSSDLASYSLEDAETHLILQAVTRCQGNKTAAAKQLGITARTLHNKMQKYKRLGLLD